MAYLKTGEASYPIRIGHEWCGTVSAVGDGVDPTWLGRRVTGTPCWAASAANAAFPAASTCALTAVRSASATAGRARWPRSCPCPRSPSSRCPPLWTLRWVRWWSRARTRCGRFGRPASTRASGCWSSGPGTIGRLVALIAASYGFQTHLLGPSGWDTVPGTASTPSWTRPTGTRSRRSRSTSSRPAVGSSTSDSPRHRAWSTPAASCSRTSPSSASSADPPGWRASSSSTRPAPSTRDRWWPPPSASTTRAAVLAGHRDPSWGDAPKIHIDPGLHG
jgi:hypothetical protein